MSNVKEYKGKEEWRVTSTNLKELKAFFCIDKSLREKRIILGRTEVFLPKGTYIPTRRFPVWGSKYQSIGTVTRLLSKLETKVVVVRVEWQTGHSVSLSMSQLLVIDETKKGNPNFEFLLTKIKYQKRKGVD